MLVYGVGVYCLIVLYAEHRPDRVDAFLCVYALGACSPTRCSRFFRPTRREPFSPARTFR